MTNEDYLDINTKQFELIKEGEKRTFDYIYQLDEKADLPPLAEPFANKMYELFELFRYDDDPLDQHAIVVIETQYLHSLFEKATKDIRAHYDALIKALEKDDTEALINLIRSAPRKKQEWKQISERISSFDFMDNLEDAINSGIKLPHGCSKESAYKTCMEELRAIDYDPSSKESEFGSNKKH